MSEVRGITGVVSPDRATKDDARLGLRMLRDGTPLSAEWLAGLQMEGRGFIANAGTVTSPITFGAGSIDSTEPDLGLTIAANTRWIIPYSIQVVFETFGTTLLLEGMAAAGTGLVLGTDTDVTPVSVRTHSQYTSQASVGVASAADGLHLVGAAIRHLADHRTSDAGFGPGGLRECAGRYGLHHRGLCRAAV